MAKHKLPVPLESITGLGMNPLREEWKHRDLDGKAQYMEFAWDFCVPKGTPLYATKAGVVYLVRDDSALEPTEDEAKILAESVMGKPHPEAENIRRKLYAGTNGIILDHRDGTFSLYSHMQKDGSVVNQGDEVEAGQQIGYSGNTGCSCAPHLHFEIYKPREDLNASEALLVDDIDKRQTIEPDFGEETMRALKDLVKRVYDIDL